MKRKTFDNSLISLNSRIVIKLLQNTAVYFAKYSCIVAAYTLYSCKDKSMKINSAKRKIEQEVAALRTDPDRMIEIATALREVVGLTLHTIAHEMPMGDEGSHMSIPQLTSLLRQRTSRHMPNLIRLLQRCVDEYEDQADRLEQSADKKEEKAVEYLRAKADYLQTVIGRRFR